MKRIYLIILMIIIKSTDGSNWVQSLIVFCYTIIYVLLFAVIDLNWIDLFTYIYNNVTLKL